MFMRRWPGTVDDPKLSSSLYCFQVCSCKSNKQLLFMYKTTGPSYMTKGRHQFLDSVYKLTTCTRFWDKLQSVKMFYNDHNGYLHSPFFFTTEGIICCNLNNSVNLTLLHVCNTVYFSLVHVKCDVFLCYIILANYPVSVTWTMQWIHS